MVKTIFDAIEEIKPTGKEGFFKAAESLPSSEETSNDFYLKTLKNYGKTILKGTIEGVSKLGKMMGPTLEEEPREELEKQTKTLEELLPTEEDFGQRAIRRGLKEGPSILGFPGASLATIPRVVLAGFLGEGAKDLKAPEWAQTALELTAYIGPDITKKLIESGKNKDIIQSARNLGLSDEAITPLIQSDFKQKWLTKLMPKRGATEKALSRSKYELSEAYNTIQKSDEALKLLPEQQKDKLFKSFFEKFKDMPHGVRKTVKTDLKDLLDKPINGESLINFYKDINYNLGSKTKQLSLLKDPIKDALYSISPQLGKDFDLINNLHSKFYPLAKKLKPNIADDIIRAAEKIGLLGAFFTGNYPTIYTILGEKAGRTLAQQMIINPRLQQFSSKMIDAVNSHKYGMAAKISNLIKDEINKSDTDLADKFETLSKEDFENIFNRQKIKK